jgi:predicted HTH domain antitoxin
MAEVSKQYPQVWGTRPGARYKTEGLSLAKAASLAGVSWAQMKDILVERHIQPRLGGETVEEAEQEVQTLRAYFQDQP